MSLTGASLSHGPPRGGLTVAAELSAHSSASARRPAFSRAVREQLVC